MALPSATISFPSRSLHTFHEQLKHSTRILALLGAGLSASSGLATYRGVGSGGLWRGQDPAELVRPEAFKRDPALVWSLHQDRRRQALEAEPSEGHYALARLAEKKGRDGFLMLSMNVDGLCSRAGVPADQLLELHGSLFDLRCSGDGCDYAEKLNTDKDMGASEDGLPKCPKCQTHLLRPAIIWFGEAMNKSTVAAADAYIQNFDKIDLILVVGTTAQVWPASGYVDAAIEKGARVAMVNIDRGDLIPGGGELGLTDRDWFGKHLVQTSGSTAAANTRNSK